MPILNVPYSSQWTSTASRYRTDCGVACTLMILNYYGKSDGKTVDQLASETTLPIGDVGLMPSQLVALADKHGLKLRVSDNTTEDQIRAEIDAGRPVIALIAYRFILNRLDQGDNKPFNDGHFIVIVGYDDTHFVANDPDYWTTFVEKGHDTLINITQLDEAIAGNGYHRACVFVDKENQMSLDTILANLNSIQTALTAAIADTKAEIAASQPAPVPAPVPVPVPPPAGSKVATVNDGGANVRVSATIKATKIATLNAGTSLNVIDTGVDQDGYHWWKIADGQYANGFVAHTVISFP